MKYLLPNISSSFSSSSSSIKSCTMKEGSDSAKKLERKSSIESEPQTLSLYEIQYAREAALYVINTRSFEEAINIFTEGLQPVRAICSRMDDDDEFDLLEDDQRNAHLVDEGVRDIATAPF